MAEEKTETKQIDYVKKIGRNFNPNNAREIFGDKAYAALDAVAAAGGYGVHTEKDYTNPLFGGFAIPDPALVKDDAERAAHYTDIRAKINAALNALK